MNIQCLVIDDEELARTLLKTYISKVDFLEVVGDFENPIEALKKIKETKIDLIFLDIQMPELKGTDFAKIINPETKIIFTTAYTEYAIEGFNLNVLDYLLKPITFNRFLEAIHKFKTTTNTEQTITIKSGYDLFKVNYSDIRYIKSDSEYVTYYTVDKKIMSLQSLKTIENTFPSSKFLRVHRSYIINKSKVTALKGRELILGETRIPISDSYFDKVKSELF
tara:strand:+ start:55274 stop:55939 length:666 start_codon:yes stop_codon:yes gene_type:complete